MSAPIVEHRFAQAVISILNSAAARIRIRRAHPKRISIWYAFLHFLPLFVNADCWNGPFFSSNETSSPPLSVARERDPPTERAERERTRQAPVPPSLPPSPRPVLPSLDHPFVFPTTVLCLPSERREFEKSLAEKHPHSRRPITIQNLFEHFIILIHLFASADTSASGISCELPSGRSSRNAPFRIPVSETVSFGALSTQKVSNETNCKTPKC